MRSIPSLPRKRARTKLGDAHCSSRAASATSRASSALTFRLGSARVAIRPKCNIFTSFSPPSAYHEEIFMSRIAFAVLALGLAAAFPVGAQQSRPRPARRPASRVAAPAAVTIPYQRYTLKNGLTLLVDEDHKAPIVAVNIWYHVGSKNEKPGRTGFAHLFEHLMFNGSENFNDDYFKEMDQIGATDLNGTTSEDRTNYFENAPKNALDIVLWLESDRMGHFAGAITQPRLDEKRGVGQNE